ncbi:tetratricopeptide repeat protein 12 [Anastrepha obliqua]|uniref:tetratricopeptide repeat protein 12 n=1 Tax=Anastrepha ludens TaxID=28586 RepID=UPI0023B0E16C|nr:tetratricopeptide repeat protein 12 [Anastrepha ludens]XP_054736309.1 tetratricopeptide repeat protein 12 [Anastrepha obliqua]
MAMTQGDMDEDFLTFESKVNQVMKLLEDMASANKSDAEGGTKKPDTAGKEEINEENFIVSVRQDRTVLNRKAAYEKDQNEQGDPQQMDKYTFMHQMEQDAAERAKVRQERERIAQNFRRLGNEAFRKQNFEKAIQMYTKAIEHVKDSPILYNNRALCYLKLRNSKRAIIDADYVINKLDEKNLRAWLYRAAAYLRLGDEKNYETSIKFAKKNNSKEIDYITAFQEKLRIDF